MLSAIAQFELSIKNIVAADISVCLYIFTMAIALLLLGGCSLFCKLRQASKVALNPHYPVTHLDPSNFIADPSVPVSLQHISFHQASRMSVDLGVHVSRFSRLRTDLA
jgi:hypothetical protein